MTKKPSKTSEVFYAAGDIVVVPFPYSDQLAEKRRPALVVSSRSFNSKHALLWTVMITSAAHELSSHDVALPVTKSGLPNPSMIRASKIATIEPHRIIRKLKSLDKEIMAKVRKLITETVS